MSATNSRRALLVNATSGITAEMRTNILDIAKKIAAARIIARHFMHALNATQARKHAQAELHIACADLLSATSKEWGIA
jgi:hypothetical protein